MHFMKLRNLFFLVLGSVALTMGLSATFGFIALDDSKHIWSNPYVVTLSWANLKMFWQNPYYGLFIPLVYNIWAVVAAITQWLGLEHAITEFAGQPFHILNLSFHFFSALLVMVLVHVSLRQLNFDLHKLPWVFLCGLIFAIHPLQVEPVAWVSGFKDVLMTFFSLLSWLSYWLYSTPPPNLQRGKKTESPWLWFKPPVTAKQKMLWAGLGPIFFALALLCKPAALGLPLVLMVCNPLIWQKNFKKSVSELIWWLIPALYIVWLTKAQQPDARMEFTLIWWERVMMFIYSLGFYIWKFLLPLQLAPDYGLTPKLVLYTKSFWLLFAVGSVYLLCGAWLWLKWRRYFVGWLMIFVGLLPVSGLIHFEYQNMSQVADRYVYFLPMLGFIWLMLLLLERLSVEKLRPLLGGLFLILILLSLMQTRYWRDNTSLFRQTLRVNPRSYLAYNNLGLSSMREGRLDEAIGLLQKSLESKADYTAAQSNLGAAFFRKQDYASVIRHYDGVFAANPQLGVGSPAVYADMYFNYAAALINSRKILEGQRALEKSVQINPDHYMAQFNLGRLLAQTKQDHIKAANHLREALRLNPSSKEARQELLRIGVSNP